MKTPEELKAEAIKKAWIAEIGEENFNKISPDENGWYFYQLNEYRQLIKGFSPRDMQVEYNYRKQDNVNLIYFYRPKSLSGIENNNGWIRIEPDGSNLPDKIIDCWCIKDRLMFYPLLWRKDLMQFQTTDASYYDWQEFTHYQRIVEPQPPIF